MRPYSIEFNLDKKRIVLHYKEKPDIVIDKNKGRKYVNNKIVMPPPEGIDCLTDEWIERKKKDIENNPFANDKAKEVLMRDISTPERRNKIRMIVEFDIQETQKSKLAEELTNECLSKIDLDFILSIVKE